MALARGRGGAGGRIISGIQALTGGKGTAYAEEIEKARKEALDDLRNEARKLGANGVLSIDFETSEILHACIEKIKMHTCLRAHIHTIKLKFPTFI